jgi:hypothetical protein
MLEVLEHYFLKGRQAIDQIQEVGPELLMQLTDFQIEFSARRLSYAQRTDL